MTTLENKFPLLAVEQGCIISKGRRHHGGFRGGAAGALHRDGRGVRGDTRLLVQGDQGAAGLLRRPQAGLVHQGDATSRSFTKDDMSFLSRSFERHFNERPYLKHTCYLYLTKTTKERNRMQSNFSTLCRGHIIPKELDRETTTKFMEACEQFERIMNDSGLVRLRRLSTDEIVGTEGKAGLIERYFSLMPEGDTTVAGHRASRQGRCASATTACACTPSPTRKTCRARWLPTPVTRSSPPTARTAACPSPPRWGCCSPATTSTTSMCLIDNSEENLAEVREVRPEHAVALALFEEQQHQPRVDRPIPERSALLRADLGTGALQRHGVERRRGGTEAHQERRGQPAGKHGVRAAPQHHRLPDTLLGGDTRQRGGLPGGREFPHLHRTGGVPLHGGNQLPQLALALRHQDGGQAHGKTAAPRHQRPADEAGYHHQPQQVRAGSFGQRQVVLHEPPRAPILRAGRACGIGGHGKLLSGLVRA